MELVGGQLGAAQDEPHLRPVAVADRHVPAVLDEAAMCARLAERRDLVRDGLVLRVLDQRVAADRDD